MEHKKGTIGWLKEQAKKDGFDDISSWNNWKKSKLSNHNIECIDCKTEIINNIDKTESIPKVLEKIQCVICNKYFQQEVEIDGDICDDCWILVNNNLR